MHEPSPSLGFEEVLQVLWALLQPKLISSWTFCWGSELQTGSWSNFWDRRLESEIESLNTSSEKLDVSLCSKRWLNPLVMRNLNASSLVIFWYNSIFLLQNQKCVKATLKKQLVFGTPYNKNTLNDFVKTKTKSLFKVGKENMRNSVHPSSAIITLSSNHNSPFLNYRIWVLKKLYLPCLLVDYCSNKFHFPCISFLLHFGLNLGCVLKSEFVYDFKVCQLCTDSVIGRQRERDILFRAQMELTRFLDPIFHIYVDKINHPEIILKSEENNTTIQSIIWGRALLG